jgi:splicing factor U2AF subunit
MEGMSAYQVKSTGLFPLPGQVLGTRAPQSFQPPPPKHDGHRGHSPVNALAVRQSKRLYVGQIPYDIDERPIADFFNNNMRQLQLADRSAVVAVTINHDKNYAFVDFETPEQASAVMNLDGIMFQGQQLKIRRPKDYQPPVENSGYDALQVPGLVSTNVADTPNKIFIGGLPVYLNDDQVVELLKSFGELRSFNLVKDTSNGQNKGFAFCEYMDPNVTDLACQGLNNMELGDRKLIVQRASIGAKQGNIPSDYMTHVPLTAADYLPISGVQEDEATRVLQLMNMVTPEELEDDEEFKDIWEDIADECSKFGTVVDMKIPRPNQGGDVPGLGLIFVRYESKDQTLEALNALAGRKFADRTVVATFIDEENYLADNF